MSPLHGDNTLSQALAPPTETVLFLPPTKGSIKKREAANSRLSMLLPNWIVDQVHLPDREINTNRAEDEKNMTSFCLRY